MGITVSDSLRYLCAGIGLLLVPTCIYCVFQPMSWDQRLRFIALALLGIITVGRQLASLGKEGNWSMPVLAVAMGAALLGSGMYMRRIRAEEDGEQR